MSKRAPRKTADENRVEAASLARFEVLRADARKILGGVPERTFATLETEGIIVPLRRGSRGRPSVYSLETIVPAYLVYATGQRQGGDREARARRDIATAKLNELKLAKEQADLLPRAVVVEQGQAYTKAWAAKVRSLPRRARQTGVITTGEQETGLTSLTRELLTEISGWQTLADAERSIDTPDTPETPDTAGDISDEATP